VCLIPSGAAGFQKKLHSQKKERKVPPPHLTSTIQSGTGCTGRSTTTSPCTPQPHVKKSRARRRAKKRLKLQANNLYRPGKISDPRSWLVTQPASSAMVRSCSVQAQCHSLPGALERRLGLVLLELTKRRPRVSKRIQPVWMETRNTRVRLRANSSPKRVAQSSTRHHRGPICLQPANNASQGTSTARRRCRSARPGKQDVVLRSPATQFAVRILGGGAGLQNVPSDAVVLTQLVQSRRELHRVVCSGVCPDLLEDIEQLRLRHDVQPESREVPARGESTRSRHVQIHSRE